MGLPELHHWDDGAVKLVTAGTEERADRNLLAQNPDLLGDLPNGHYRFVEIRPGMGGRQLATQPSCAVRNHRIPKTGYEYPVVKQQFAHADRICSLADNDRNNRCLAVEWFQAGFHERRSEITDILM